MALRPKPGAETAALPKQTSQIPEGAKKWPTARALCRDIWRKLQAPSSKNALPGFCSVTGITSMGAIPQQSYLYPGQLPSQAQLFTRCWAAIGSSAEMLLDLTCQETGPRHPTFQSLRRAERAHPSVQGKIAEIHHRPFLGSWGLTVS